MPGQQPEIDALLGQLLERIVAAGLDHLIEIRLTDGEPAAVLEGGTAELVLRLAGRYEEADVVASLRAARDWDGYLDRVIDAFRSPA